MELQKLGEYQIVREIGAGGMGKVYEGTAPDGTRVAIKTMLLSPDMDSKLRWEAVERFQREARAIRALQHRNIVSVLDVGEDQGQFYIVLEYLDGQSVKELIDMAGGLKVERASEIIMDVCSALNYAHEQGVIHRDIKPANIMVLKNGVVKLTDFGLAGISSEVSITETGTMMGTFSYMSPEQVRGEKLDARSDIFSLGVTFYEMVSGQKPFAGEGTAAVLEKILNEEPPPLRGVPLHVSHTINKCMKKDPKLRFQSTKEVIASLDIGKTAVGRPSVAVGPPITRPTVKVTPQPQRPTITVPKEKVVPMRKIDRCLKCGQPWTPGAVVCWNCGEEHPDFKAKKERKEAEQTRHEILDLASKLAPKKKKRWWKL